jgi:hypothetical protein
VGIPSIGRKSSRTVLWGELAWHPAAQAWTAFMGGAGAPDTIEVLHDGKRSATYRLVGAGPDGKAVIVRRARALRATIQRAWYELIVPRLPLRISRPRYRGSRKDGGNRVWLFFNDTTQRL